MRVKKKAYEYLMIRNDYLKKTHSISIDCIKKRE